MSVMGLELPGEIGQMSKAVSSPSMHPRRRFFLGPAWRSWDRILTPRAWSFALKSLSPHESRDYRGLGDSEALLVALVEIVAVTLRIGSRFYKRHATKHVKSSEDQHHMRCPFEANGLVAFIADGAVLSRKRSIFEALKGIRRPSVQAAGRTRGSSRVNQQAAIPRNGHPNWHYGSDWKMPLRQNFSHRQSS